MKNRYFEPVFAVVQDHPSVAAGTLTFAIAFALVAGNAFYAQSGTHPDPIWATRDATFTHSVEKTIRPVRTTTVKPRAIAVPTQRQEAKRGKPVSSPMVAAVQAALINTGDYNGEIDGLMGPMTRTAIVDYQRRNKMEMTGNASRNLLMAIQNNTPVVTKTRQSDSLSSLIDDSETSFDKNLVRLIQSGLASMGKDIAVDGIFGSKTSAAISEFQRNNNMKVTGKPDQKLLEFLKSMGVIS